MTTIPETPPESAADAPALPATHPASELRAVVVEYDCRPNRCTICPRERTREELTTAWLTADVDAFFDLAAVR